MNKKLKSSLIAVLTALAIFLSPLAATDASAANITSSQLSAEAKKYIAGLGDSGQDLAFKFLYEKEQFEDLIAMAETKSWKVEMPDGVSATFDAFPSVKFDSASPNNAITYTLTLIVESVITFA